MTDGGQRIATLDGAMLADRRFVGNPRTDGGAAGDVGATCRGGAPGAPGDWFEPGFWAGRGELHVVSGGRGSAWFVGTPPREWVLRHYRRGGWAARLDDRYVWAGEARVRAFAEWRLLASLAARALPVPRPVAARYRRSGPFYRCDLITERIAGAHPLSGVLARDSLPEPTWRDVGATVARFHDAGVDHADLNAHNILLDAAGRVSVIDFDRGGLRAPAGWRGPGAWRARNLARLRRSLEKISIHLPHGRFSPGAWQSLLAGYASARCEPSTRS